MYRPICLCSGCPGHETRNNSVWTNHAGQDGESRLARTRTGELGQITGTLNQSRRARTGRTSQTGQPAQFCLGRSPWIDRNDTLVITRTGRLAQNNRERETVAGQPRQDVPYRLLCLGCPPRLSCSGRPVQASLSLLHVLDVLSSISCTGFFAVLTAFSCCPVSTVLSLLSYPSSLAFLFCPYCDVLTILCPIFPVQAELSQMRCHLAVLGSPNMALMSESVLVNYLSVRDVYENRRS